MPIGGINTVCQERLLGRGIFAPLGSIALLQPCELQQQTSEKPVHIVQHIVPLVYSPQDYCSLIPVAPPHYCKAEEISDLPDARLQPPPSQGGLWAASSSSLPVTKHLKDLDWR